MEPQVVLGRSTPSNAVRAVAQTEALCHGRDKNRHYADHPAFNRQSFRTTFTQIEQIGEASCR